MQTLRSLLILPLLVIEIFSLSSGPEKLDRTTAAVLIKEFYGYPRVEIAKLNVASPQLVKDGWGYQRNNLNMTYFHFNGVAMPYLVRPTTNGYDISLMFMPANAEVIANCNDFGEITGIATDAAGKTAKVEFTGRRVGVTPLGAILNRKEGDILNYSVAMQLYDDGWRITAMKQENIKPETYPYFNSKGEFIGGGK